MNDDHIYFNQMIDKGQIRIGSRAIIINQSADHFLVEKNLGTRDKYLNFIGGGVELGETLEACLEREVNEETNARIIEMKYLFFVENFITFKGHITHGLGHYFLVKLDREDVRPTSDNVEFLWFSAKELADIDLRPHVVRDQIVNGTYRSIHRLISRDFID